MKDSWFINLVKKVREDRLDAVILARVFPRTRRDVRALVKENKDKWETESDFARAAIEKFIRDVRGKESTCLPTPRGKEGGAAQLSLPHGGLSPIAAPPFSNQTAGDEYEGIE